MSHLEIQSTETEQEQVVEGTLNCPRCFAHYSIHKKLPYLIDDRHLEDYKAAEMQGWVNLWEKHGHYDESRMQIAIEDSFRLPYVGHIFTDVARMFDMALEELQLTGNETILDLGAGQGWASRYFAEKGCKVIATDIVADEWYGLGRSWAIMEYANVYFEPLLADGEKLPFPDESFDIVFFCGALHHFRNFETVLEQVFRVLKPGGRLMAAGEPTIALDVRERDVQETLEETEEGIVERRAYVPEYWRAMRRVGLTNVRIDTFETFNVPGAQIYSWVLDVRRLTFGRVRPRYKPLVWLYFSLALMLPPRLAGQMALFFNGGNLIMRAKKPR